MLDNIANRLPFLLSLILHHSAFILSRIRVRSDLNDGLRSLLFNLFEEPYVLHVNHSFCPYPLLPISLGLRVARLWVCPRAIASCSYLFSLYLKD